jgi:predicted AlkP superfamily pyrophosphatase or phosphodiesterase
MIPQFVRPRTLAPRVVTHRLFLLLLVIGAMPRRGEAQVPGVEHFVVIGVDGLSPEGIRRAKTPVLHRMMAEGAATLHARGVMPTVSSPNWASMIMGAGPEQHGVLSNDWMPGLGPITPTVVGPGGIFPTVFGLLRQQKPSSKIGCFHDWDGFARLVERDVCDRIAHPKGPVETTNQAISFLKEERPTLLFIHLDHVDHAGHQHGHGTPQYDAAVEEADRLIGLVLAALRDSGMADHSLVLVTSDHGGKGKGHGGSTMDEIEIPWIIQGRGVIPGRELGATVNTYDTAATIAHALGLTPPKAWIARPVLDAFAESK